MRVDEGTVVNDGIGVGPGNGVELGRNVLLGSVVGLGRMTSCSIFIGFSSCFGAWVGLVCSCSA
ncbi:MAG: hypothetical protein CVU41_13585 [Chloroflexi bacterium HGW-Chloroflexi-3]|nr:MAG: hypothetical protein CVU41_13585 [Chloroflexi bacterium HGW-Chloroflexi-3]